MEISEEKLAEINRAREELLRRLQEDPAFRAKCEEDDRRLDSYYSFGVKEKE